MAIINGTSGSDILTGTAQADTINGLEGDDQLTGLDGSDVLNGGSGNDSLDGGLGADTLTGGSGSDQFGISSEESLFGFADTITDFETGIDKIVLRMSALSQISLVRSGTGTVLFAQQSDGAQVEVFINGLIQGSDLRTFDFFFVPGVQLLGQDGSNDLLVGNEGSDTLFGLSGNDVLNGGAGDDRLFGDAGADVLTGGTGADRFAYRGFSDSNAVDGYDIITDFANGTDKIDLTFLNGVQSVSLVRSGAGTFMFAATSGGQVQVGFTGAVQGTDLINPVGTAASFGYQLVGSAAAETLTGSSGNDTLFGLAGNDVLLGGAGDDILYGDAGGDVLTGGAGADVFAYRGGADSPVSSFDVITDFVSGIDKIDLRAVHTSAADKYGVAYQNGSALLFLDQGGDGSSEFLIVLSGVTNLQASDILF